MQERPPPGLFVRTLAVSIRMAGERQRTSRRSDAATHGPPDALPSPQTRRMVGVYEIVIMALIVYFWLVPIAYVGGMKRDASWMPRWFRHQQRIACLFTRSVSSWKSYHVQVQTGGDGIWRELDEKGFFEMTVFGYRTRLHRILGHSFRKARGQRRISEIARFMAERYRTLHPGEPPLDAIRFVRVGHRIARLARETGRFRKPALDEVEPVRMQIFGEVRFDGKMASTPGNGRWRGDRKSRRVLP